MTVLFVVDCEVFSSFVDTLVWRVGVIFVCAAFLDGLLAGLLDDFLDGEAAAFLDGDALRAGDRDLLRDGDLRAGDRDLDLLNEDSLCNIAKYTLF